jgi:hypothetical protein
VVSPILVPVPVAASSRCHSQSGEGVIPTPLCDLSKRERRPNEDSRRPYRDHHPGGNPDPPLNPVYGLPQIGRSWVVVHCLVAVKWVPQELLNTPSRMTVRPPSVAKTPCTVLPLAGCTSKNDPSAFRVPVNPPAVSVLP